jgi:hypothetical protein
MHFWGLTIDTVSCNNLIIAIGNFFLTSPVFCISYFFPFSVFPGFDGSSSTVQYSMCWLLVLEVSSVADSNPSFYFDVDLDPTFHCDVGTDPNPAPALHQSDANL